jgi:hypothetical protein
MGSGGSSGVGIGVGIGMGDVTGTRVAAATKDLTTRARAPRSLVTVRRIHLRLAVVNVYFRTRPLPSAQFLPPRPSGPSSVQRYVHGAASQTVAFPFKVVTLPAIGFDGRNL